MAVFLRRKIQQNDLDTSDNLQDNANRALDVETAVDLLEGALADIETLGQSLGDNMKSEHRLHMLYAQKKISKTCILLLDQIIVAEAHS